MKHAYITFYAPLYITGWLKNYVLVLSTRVFFLGHSVWLLE